MATPIRRLMVLGFVFIAVSFFGCAADPHKSRPKSVRQQPLRTDFPTAIEAGLAPTTSVTK